MAKTASLFLLVALLSSSALSRGQGTSPSKAQKSQDFIFEAQPREIVVGQAAVLRWSIKGATKVVIEEAPESGGDARDLRKIGTFEGSSGTLEVKPKETTAYVITCEGSTTSWCASITVRVRVKQR